MAELAVRGIDRHLRLVHRLRVVHGPLPVRLLRRRVPLGDLERPLDRELRELGVALEQLPERRHLLGRDHVRRVHRPGRVRLLRLERDLHDGRPLGPRPRELRQLGLRRVRLRVLARRRRVREQRRVLRRAQLPTRRDVRRALLRRGLGDLPERHRLLRLHGLRIGALHLPRGGPRLPRERGLLLGELRRGALHLTACARSTDRVEHGARSDAEELLEEAAGVVLARLLSTVTALFLRHAPEHLLDVTTAAGVGRLATRSTLHAYTHGESPPRSGRSARRRGPSDRAMRHGIPRASARVSWPCVEDGARRWGAEPLPDRALSRRSGPPRGSCSSARSRPRAARRRRGSPR